MSGLAEEAPAAYKDVPRVVELVHKLGDRTENCKGQACCRCQSVAWLLWPAQIRSSKQTAVLLLRLAIGFREEAIIKRR